MKREIARDFACVAVGALCVVVGLGFWNVYVLDVQFLGFRAAQCWPVLLVSVVFILDGLFALLAPFLRIYAPTEVVSGPRWRREYRFPPGPGPRRGATLATAMVAMMLVAICLTMVMQAYMQGNRARHVQACRVVAEAACRGEIETARAHGYAALRPPGSYSFDVRSSRPMTGALTIAAGPVAASKLVTATVTWPADDATPAGNATLSTIMSARGIGG